MTTEAAQALEVATRWLDGDMNAIVQMVPGDPDCDACVLARQYVRALERHTTLAAVTLNLARLAMGFVEVAERDELPQAKRAREVLERIIRRLAAALPESHLESQGKRFGASEGGASA